MKQLTRKGCLRIVLTLLAAFGWWGLFFPEFTLNQDTVCIYVTETDASAEAEEASDASEDYSGEELLQLLLQAEPTQIQFRSKLLKEIKIYWEAFSWDRSTWN